MTWLITAVVVSGVVTARAAQVVGEEKKIELEKAAEEEKLSAESQELQRRQQLNKVLAANQVAGVTSGISGEGTPQSIALATARTASASEALEGLSSRLKQAQLRRQGRSARTGGRLAATSTLLKSGIQIAGLS